MVAHDQCAEVVYFAGAFASHASALTNNDVRGAAWVDDSGCGREPGGAWSMNLVRALNAHSEKGGATIQ
jgi:hypothetical protein